MEDLKVEGYIWVETKTGVKIGKGRALLLEEIEKTGSIAEAARKIKIPYRKAWEMIKEMNESSPFPLVIKSLGGKNGGGSVLTKEGRKILSIFKKINNQFSIFKKSNYD